VAAVAALLVAGACSAGYDAGSTPEEQLCDVLEQALEPPDGRADFRLEPVLEGTATDPAELPFELLALNLAFRAHESSYDQLGPFRPAITFAATLVNLAVDDLIGPTELTPTVVESALAVDEALDAGACEA
jgi:hypothetical protein